MEDILSKFGAVTVDQDTRITAEDRAFCQKNQDAYEEAINNYQELRLFWEAMEEAQNKLLDGVLPKYRHDYLHSARGPEMTKERIARHVQSLHKDFIAAVINYFRNEYKVSINEDEIAAVLLPKEPKVYSCNDIAAATAYQEQLEKLRVKYQDVVEQIMLRMNGRQLTEQAFHELRTKCHDAAYRSGEPRFERRKNVITFADCFCRRKSWPYNAWELYDGAKDILRGMAHFETGSYQTLPAGISEMVSSYYLENDIFDLSGCDRLRQVKLFKNGRADLRFSTDSDATLFISTYLAA